MRILKALILIVSIGTIAACATKFKQYNGPEVTRVLVYKKLRKVFLMHNDRVLKRYHMELGFAPVGHKQFEGDGKTPEGQYIINRRNPNSAFYLSLGISYPNAKDRAKAHAMGKSPGGDIFIHGDSRPNDPSGADWTAGCISVSDRQMRTIYSMVKNGTPIFIYP